MSHPYENLSPDLMLDAVERAGFVPDGHIMALNSYENRVVQIGVEYEDRSDFLVAKFYRPDRWSDVQILEEHTFALQLAAAEIPVVAPLRLADEKTLLSHEGFRFALYPRQGGRRPDLEDLDRLEWIGRFIGRIHQTGAARPFAHRPTLTPAVYGGEAAGFLIDNELLPVEFRQHYRELTERLMIQVEQAFTELAPKAICLHGDCHASNILWTDQGPHFVDLDDCRNGPAIQDLWMLLHGDRAEMTLQMSCLLDGYRTFMDFRPRELGLIEPLRTMRLIHYAGWLARRWTDPAFPLAFPWFGNNTYWSGHLQDLEQQAMAMEAEPLHLY